MANKRAGALIYRVTMDTNDDNKLNQDNAQGEANGMPISYSLETLPVSLETEMKRSYLDYAMSVIVGRALPDVRDGFKPVHRRVLFSMHELGNDFSHATKKCARIVGDVIGKYHPHGDQAVYQTLVRLAQDFSMRYPLVWGQGNFGSIDGDGAAAMRYTECRLARIADAMLDDLEEDTVDFVPNFDNSEKEPSVLPARLPNLLVNGSAGIAVGMATNIPPHNLRETIDACRHLLHNPDASIDELIARMPAPDFPTGAIIYGLKGVHEGYRTGRGRVIMRAHTHFEETKSGRQMLVVDDIPYQVNKKVLVESIARLMRDKKIEGISELRDESSKSVRIVMELKAGTFGEVVRNNLFKLTQLQWTFGINMVALVDGRPRVLNLREIIEAFLRHRREVINRRTIFRLNKNRMRGHILEGQAVALSNLDEFLRIIRNAPNPPIAREQLMSRGWKSDLVSGLLNAAFNPQDYRPQDIDACYGLLSDGLYHLSPVQADKILQMALQKLTGLEQDKINEEYRQANAQITDLLDILARPERVVQIMDAELAELKDKFGDERRSEIDPSGDPNFNPLDFVPEETMVVTLSREGYIKRQSLTEYRSQRRGGQGKAAAKLKEGDEIDRIITASSHDQALCFSNFGRVYALPIYQIPEGSRTSKGKAIVNLLDIAEGESIMTILPVSRFDESHYVFLATVNGVMKKTSLKEFAVIKRMGKAAITLDDNDSILTAVITDGTQDIMVFGSNGKVLRFDENEVRPMGRTARGVLTMKLPEGHKCVSMFAVHADTNMEVLTVCASTGDTSAAAALYAAYVGAPLKSVVLLPHGKVTPQQLSQPLGSGATVLELPGVFDDCMKVVELLAENYRVALLNSKNSWRILGQESYAYETAQWYGWNVADLCLFVPIGNAGNITAIMSGFLKLLDLGIMRLKGFLLIRQRFHSGIQLGIGHVDEQPIQHIALLPAHRIHTLLQLQQPCTGLR